MRSDVGLGVLYHLINFSFELHVKLNKLRAN